MDEFNDTLETAPIVPRTRRSVDAAAIRELRNSTKFARLKDRFRAECSRHRNSDGSVGAPCHLCGGDIDYRLSYPHPFSWSLDHRVAVKDNAGLLMDPQNFAASHLDCNLGRGSDEPGLDIGLPSEVW